MRSEPARRLTRLCVRALAGIQGEQPPGRQMAQTWQEVIESLLAAQSEAAEQPVARSSLLGLRGASGMRLF